MSIYYNIAPGHYDRIFKESNGPRGKWHQYKFDTLRREMPVYTHHLDIGCAAGTFIGSLPKEKSSIGIDIAQDQIAYATETYGSDNHQFLHLAHTTSLPFDDNTFDCITAIELIEHLAPAENRYLTKEIHRVLQPGGCFLVTTPNYKSLWPLLELGLVHAANETYDEQHISRFSQEQLFSLLSAEGFINVHTVQTQGFACFLAWIHHRLADHAHTYEHILEKRYGLLLMGKAYKQ